MPTVPELLEQLKKAHSEIDRLKGLLSIHRKKSSRLEKRMKS